MNFRSVHFYLCTNDVNLHGVVVLRLSWALVPFWVKLANT